MFHEVTFPLDASYDTSGGPGYNTIVLELDSGAEVRIARWATPRRRFNVAYTVKSQAQLNTLIAFYKARQGALYGFRFQDWSDYSSAADNISAPANTNVVIGVGNGVTASFQLIKKYTSGAQTHTRVITKPAAGTVTVALDGVNQTSFWTVDTTTGIITFAAGHEPGVGVVVSVGYYFFVPVRFSDDADKALMATIDDYSTRSVDNLTLIEIKDTGAYAEEYNYGGSVEQAITSDVTLSLGEGTGRVIRPLAAGLAAVLPDPTNIPGGTGHFLVWNDSPTYTLAVKLYTGTTLVTLATGASAEISLSVDGGGTKFWYTR